MPTFLQPVDLPERRFFSGGVVLGRILQKKRLLKSGLLVSRFNSIPSRLTAGGRAPFACGNRRGVADHGHNLTEDRHFHLPAARE